MFSAILRATMPCMKRIISITFTIFLFVSCNWGEDHEYVTVLVCNHVPEPIMVETGLTFIESEVPAEGFAYLSIVADVTVCARGKISKTSYGCQIFLRYGEPKWEIY
jgi:hypothetical protein